MSCANALHEILEDLLGVQIQQCGADHTDL